MKLFIQFTLLILINSFLYSHQYHESYLNFDYNKTLPSLQWEIESDNLNLLFNFDDNNNGIISWKELNNHRDTIINYSKNYFKVKIDNKDIKLNFKNYNFKQYDDQTYMVINIILPTDLPKKIEIDYSLFFKMDALQKCLIKMNDKNSTSVYILSPNREKIIIEHQKISLVENLREFFVDGIWHILVGIDHILFLLMLILPSVKNQTNFKRVLIQITKIITAFSIAHSISLLLSAFEVISISSKLVNILIAFSVFFTALNNILNSKKFNSWKIAFAFGLIHGFGFANALSGLELTTNFFIYFVAIFNIGIEFGQLLIVFLVVPLLFIIKNTQIYEKLILKIGSLMTILISLYWIIG